MVFFDENSLINHRELDKEIDKLEQTNEYYQEQIAKFKDFFTTPPAQEGYDVSVQS